MTKWFKFATITFIMIMLLSPSILSAAQHPGGGGDDETKTEIMTFTGDTNEGSSWEKAAELGEIDLISIEFVLTWEDEESSTEPDTFSLTTDDGGHEPKSAEDSSGSISTSWGGPDLNTTWNVIVTCENAGDEYGPLGQLQITADSGNKWTLTITYVYTESGGGGGGGPPPRVQAVLNSPVFKTHIAFMIASVFLYLGTGLIALAFLTRNAWGKRVSETSTIKRIFSNPKPLVFIVLLTWLIFFIAAVPLGMWVAGMYYGAHKAWTGFPALWNPEAFEMTNADNVSFIVLALWALPMYLNRAWVMKGKRFEKLFGRITFAMKRAAKAPAPKLSYREFALCYFLMGIFIFVVFEVQPHGSGS